MGVEILFVHGHSLLESLESRIDLLESRVHSVESRIDLVESRIDVVESLVGLPSKFGEFVRESLQTCHR